MFSYLFSASKKPVADGLHSKPNQSKAEAVLEPVTESVPEKNLEAENEQLKAQIQTLLAEKAELEKTIKNLRRDSEVYRDLMFTKVCTCNN
jgi:hypothetical protein